MRASSAFIAVATLTCLSVAVPTSSRAEDVPSLAGYATLGHVTVDKNGCASCPAVIRTSKRHRAFVIASDSPFPVVLSGRVDVTCSNGATYQVFLNSPRRGGPFQMIANTCVNLETKDLTFTITSVGLSPADAEQKIELIAYGSFG